MLSTLYTESSKPVQTSPTTLTTNGSIPELRGLLSSHYSSPLILFLLGLPSSIHLIQNVKLVFVMQPSILKDLDRNNSFITVPKLLSDGNDSHTFLTAWGWTHDSDLHLIISSLPFRSPIICKNYLEQGPFSKGLPDHYVMNLSLPTMFLLFSVTFCRLLRSQRTLMDPWQWDENNWYSSFNVSYSHPLMLKTEKNITKIICYLS